jgi:hypothetical protein
MLVMAALISSPEGVAEALAEADVDAEPVGRLDDEGEPEAEAVGVGETVRVPVARVEAAPEGEADAEDEPEDEGVHDSAVRDGEGLDDAVREMNEYVAVEVGAPDPDVELVALADAVREADGEGVPVKLDDALAVALGADELLGADVPDALGVPVLVGSADVEGAALYDELVLAAADAVLMGVDVREFEFVAEAEGSALAVGEGDVAADLLEVGELIDVADGTALVVPLPEEEGDRVRSVTVAEALAEGDTELTGQYEEEGLGSLDGVAVGVYALWLAVADTLLLRLAVSVYAVKLAVPDLEADLETVEERVGLPVAERVIADILAVADVRGLLDGDDEEPTVDEGVALASEEGVNVGAAKAVAAHVKPSDATSRRREQTQHTNALPAPHPASTWVAGHAGGSYHSVAFLTVTAQGKEAAKTKPSASRQLSGQTVLVCVNPAQPMSEAAAAGTAGYGPVPSLHVSGQRGPAHGQSAVPAAAVGAQEATAGRTTSSRGMRHCKRGSGGPRRGKHMTKVRARHGSENSWTQAAAQTERTPFRRERQAVREKRARLARAAADCGATQRKRVSDTTS